MELEEVVKEKYGQAALRVNSGGSSCCGAGAALEACCDPITSNLYDAAQTGVLPEEAVLASLGCGNPTALAELKAGETVLDLGSGGGIDVCRRASLTALPVFCQTVTTSSFRVTPSSPSSQDAPLRLSRLKHSSTNSLPGCQ